MVTPLPQVPQRPTGGGRRGSFWLGILVALGVIVGGYLAFMASVDFGDGTRFHAIYASCGPEPTAVRIDGVSDSVKSGEAKIWNINDKYVEWRCGNGASFRPFTCDEGTEYLLVVRYPASNEMSIQCKALPVR